VFLKNKKSKNYSCFVCQTPDFSKNFNQNIVLFTGFLCAILFIPKVKKAFFEDNKDFQNINIKIS
jgi:hypothetical protein